MFHLCYRWNSLNLLRVIKITRGVSKRYSDVEIFYKETKVPSASKLFTTVSLGGALITLTFYECRLTRLVDAASHGWRYIANAFASQAADQGWIAGSRRAVFQKDLSTSTTDTLLLSAPTSAAITTTVQHQQLRQQQTPLPAAAS